MHNLESRKQKRKEERRYSKIHASRARLKANGADYDLCPVCGHTTQDRDMWNEAVCRNCFTIFGFQRPEFRRPTCTGCGMTLEVGDDEDYHLKCLGCGRNFDVSINDNTRAVHLLLFCISIVLIGFASFSK